MEKPIIDVQNVGKLYRVGTLGTTTLRETVERLRARWRNGKTPHAEEPSWFRPEQAGPTPNTFWALQDVSLEVARGEIVGVIGGNGAGKSTLLKILSRITEPSRGRIVLRGRVASLLEVGTGFHAELSGRENIFLNGAILGMKKGEIRSKFDEIVDFAEVGNFIDTPVKRYSSGMYVRLAFAVAAHLEPEILIIDEVLAVGDVQFQKKCLGKMREVSKSEGRTILFVSHNMDAVRRLCTRCVIVEHGKLITYEDKSRAMSHYLSNNSSKSMPAEWIDVSHMKRTGSGRARFTAIQYSSRNEKSGFQPYPHGPIDFAIAIEADSDRVVRSMAVSISDQVGTKLINIDTASEGWTTPLTKGRNIVTFKIESLYLRPGIYILSLWMADFAGKISSGDILDHVESVFEIEVVHLESQDPRMTRDYGGVVACKFQVAS